MLYKWAGNILVHAKYVFIYFKTNTTFYPILIGVSNCSNGASGNILHVLFESVVCTQWITGTSFKLSANFNLKNFF